MWSYVPPGSRYNFFAGSAQRLANGNTLVGYATIRGAVATEVDASGTAVWELKDATAVDPQPYYSTYRAVKFPVPDALEPVVTVIGPPDGATVAAGTTVTPEVRCTDRGGSSLRSCSVTGLTGGHLDTATPGSRTWSVTARDGAGNAASVTRHYTVAAAGVRVRPDAAIRLPGAAWTGNDVYGGPSRQTVRRHLTRGGSVRGRRTPPERRHHRRPAPGPRHGGQPCLPGDLPGGGTRRQPGGPAGDLPHRPPGTRTLRPAPGPGDRHPGGPRRRRAHRAASAPSPW